MAQKMNAILNQTKPVSDFASETTKPWQQLDLWSFAEQPVSESDGVEISSSDIFVTEMKTITITVNTVGVMGKGLALTAKQRFPGVYKRYRKLCNENRISVGKPYLYSNKQDRLIESGEPTNVLLFPTKMHWRGKSKMEYIEKGLEYLLENYKRWEIESLAMPALGCGLGGLVWKDVGPVMYKTLVQLDIPVEICLPTDNEVPKEQLTREFLLGEQ